MQDEHARSGAPIGEGNGESCVEGLEAGCLRGVCLSFGALANRMVDHGLADIARGQAPAAADLARLLRPPSEFNVAFDLPWPWSG